MSRRWIVKTVIVVSLIVTLAGIQPIASPTASADAMSVTLIGAASDIATIQLQNERPGPNGSTVADIFVTNKRAINYNMSFTLTGNVIAMYDGQNLFDALNQIAQTNGDPVAPYPIAANSTRDIGSVEFPPGSQLTIRLSKFGDDSGLAAVMVVMDIGTLLSKVFGGIDIGQTLNGNVNLSNQFMASLLSALGNAHFDLAAFALQIHNGDIIGALESLAQVIVDAPSVFAPILQISADTIKAFGQDLVHVLQAVDAAPIIADLSSAPDTGSFQITNTATSTPAFAPGDVMVGVGDGMIKHFSPTGTLLDTLDTTHPSEDTGMCFDGANDMYTTEFEAGVASKFDANGNLVQATWQSNFNSDPESCIVDQAGNVYIGQADGTRAIEKFSPSGDLLDQYPVATGPRGTDWIDLASDQCTIYYNSEGSSIRRYNVCTKQQMPDFADGLSGPCYALRIRPNGEVMSACTNQIYRLSPSGAVMQTYPTSIYGESSFFFAANLDPDGTSFWTAGFFSGDVYKIDIETGKLLTHLTVPVLQSVAGLAVVGEITAAHLVQDYKQNNPNPPQGGTWAGTDNRGTGSPSLALRYDKDGNPTCDTIFQGGCALSAVADVAYSYGIHTIPGAQTTLDPGSLNQYLAAQGWQSCYMNWTLAATKLGLSLKSYPGSITDKINAALADKNLPILHISTNSGDGHWVVAYQQDGNDYRIVNPWDAASVPSGNTLSQDYPGVTIDQVEVLDRGSHPGGSWTLSLHSPAQLLITDPNGQQTGYVASTGATVENIPGAYYSISQGIADDSGTNPPLPNIPYFENDTPIPGTYTIQVIGTGSGPYTLDFSESSDSGSISQTSFSGIASPGKVDTFQVQVSGGAITIQPSDTTPPTTSASATLGTSNTPYTFGTLTNQSVQVTLSATDTVSGSGVANTYYAVDNPACTPSALTNCTTYGGSPFTVSGDGTHTVTFFSVDNAGNAEAANTVTAKIDQTPPTTTASGTLGSGSSPYTFGTWTKQSVKVTLSATDTVTGSGVAHTYDAVDKAACTPAALTSCATYTGSPLSISTAGVHTLTYFSQDVAGNLEPANTAQVKIDKTAPTCVLSGSGTNAQGQKYIQITVRDTASGLAAQPTGVVVTENNNATMSLPTFTAGTTGALVVTATKIDQSQGSQVALKVTDQAGNVTNCDPVLTSLIRDSHQPTTTTATGILQSEHLLHIYNGNPGLTHLTIKVNGKKMHERDLTPNQQYTIDVAAALQPGSNNTVTVIARGKQRGEATIVIADS